MNIVHALSTLEKAEELPAPVGCHDDCYIAHWVLFMSSKVPTLKQRLRPRSQHRQLMRKATPNLGLRRRWTAKTTKLLQQLLSQPSPIEVCCFPVTRLSRMYCCSGSRDAASDGDRQLDADSRVALVPAVQEQ